MNYHICEKPPMSKQASVISWITGASIAFLVLINLAMFFWTGQASFVFLAFLCAAYLPTPLTNSRMEGIGAWSSFTSIAAALAYGAICAVQCWWLTLLALAATVSITWLLYRQHRKQPFHLPRRPGVTFQCPSDQVWIPLYHFTMLLVFAILSMPSFPISISLFLLLLSLLAAAFGLRNWAWGIALEPDGLTVYSLQHAHFYPWAEMGTPLFGVNRWYLYDRQDRCICAIPALEATTSALPQKLEEILCNRLPERS